MKVTAFDPGGLDVVSLGLFSTGYVSTSSNSYSSAVSSNTLAIGGVSVTGAAASTYHMLASSPTAAAWVPDSAAAAGVDTTVAAVAFIIDGGGSAITTGIKGDLRIPFACTINSWTLLADQSGSIVIDVWKDTYGNYPPTNADAMPGSGKEPTITTATKAEDTTITDWTTDDVTAGDTLRFNVDSCTSITRVTLALKVTRT